MSGTISGVFVIARNTAMTYKGKPVDAKAIGKDLGVRYVLEGSVQPSGNQVRVNAQLIDAGSGAHLWAEQFDTPRADLLQTQDEIVTVLARAMELQLPQAEAARAKRTRAANPDAEDMALQGFAAVVKGGYVGKEADAGYALCEQALRVDPNNVRALWVLSMKFHLPVLFGMSADPQADLKRADELVSQALALDPANAAAHNSKAWILHERGRFEEAIAERERTLALDPADLNAMMSMAWDHLGLGRYEKGLEIFDEAIRLSPRSPELKDMYSGKSWAYFGLKQYDQAIDWARQAIAAGPSNPGPYQALVAALALTGHEAEAQEALQHYLALPSNTRAGTIAALKAYNARFANESTIRASSIVRNGPTKACARRGCRRKRRRRTEAYADSRSEPGRCAGVWLERSREAWAAGDLMRAVSYFALAKRRRLCQVHRSSRGVPCRRAIRPTEASTVTTRDVCLT